MKIKKLICLAAAVSVMALALTACGGKKTKEISVDVQKMADELNEKTVTSDTLSATNASMIPTIYLVSADLVASGAAYTSSGATACEVAVIECADASKASDLQKAFESHVKSQSELYASYNPDEVAKLDKAVIDTEGKYAVLCVCDDPDAAKEIIKSYGF